MHTRREGQSALVAPKPNPIRPLHNVHVAVAVEVSCRQAVAQTSVQRLPRRHEHPAVVSPHGVDCACVGDDEVQVAVAIEIAEEEPSSSS